MIQDTRYVIFDTDMDTDCDDVGALALILKQSKAKLIGIVTDAPSPHAAAACEALCRYFGTEVPIGTIYDAEYPEEETDRYVMYRKHKTDVLPPEIFYNKPLAEEVDKTDLDYPSSAEAFRKALVSAPDGSVTVIVVGFLTAIEKLWKSGPDEISELSGYDLFKKKVRNVVTMGNADYPECTDNIFNYWMDKDAAELFFKDCPCPIYVSPDGGDIVTGYSLSEKLPEDDPVRRSYEIYNGGQGRGRMSWDLVTTVYALGEDDELFDVTSYGTVRYSKEMNKMYWESGERKDSLVKLKISSDEMREILEKRLTD